MCGYKLRAHHGVCACFFAGMGYSDEFIRNLDIIVKALKAGTTVTLTAGWDDVCACCPETGHCGGDAERYDKAVLELCGLAPGDTLDSLSFLEIIHKRILEPGLREQVCGDCRWSGVCR